MQSGVILIKISENFRWGGGGEFQGTPPLNETLSSVEELTLCSQVVTCLDQDKDVGL